jgi:hypothetical protein
MVIAFLSLLGGIELGLAHLDIHPEVEPIITRMTRAFVEEAAGEVGRLAQLAGWWFSSMVSWQGLAF